MVIGGAFLLLSKAGVFTMTSLGVVLFHVVTWLAMAAVAAAGLFFTSDCLSEEKREGTLGFLFLTDLRGYDVVGGKLLATSLRCFYALLAVMPVLAVTMLMGGVTGEQFWKTSLALFNALLCSLAAGMFVSALSRDPQKAMAATFSFLMLWIFGGMLADWICGLVARRSLAPRWSLTSPFYVFVMGGAWERTPFCTALGIMQVMAWILVGLASVLATDVAGESDAEGGGEGDVVLCLAVRRRGTPRAPAAQTHRTKSGALAGVPGALAIAGALDDGVFVGSCGCDPGGAGYAQRSLGCLAHVRLGVHGGTLFVDGVAGGPLFYRSAAQRTGRAVDGDDHPRS
jgi:hypothetical protein